MNPFLNLVLVSTCLICVPECFAAASLSENEGSFNGSDSDDVVLDQINGTQNFRINRKNKENKPWYEGREMKLVQCVRKAKCEPLKYKTCLETKLPYSHTSLRLTFSNSQEKAFEKLQQYTVLKHIPKCWAVIQPFLCATFMPKCEEINGQDMVYLPSLEMCRLVTEPCKLIYNTTIFPKFLKCNQTFFPTKCDNDVREMKFNNSGRCLPPLVHTDIPFHFYEGISGCGLPCRDPLYTVDEHNQIRRLILWGASIGMALTLFTIATFMIDWRSSNKYPALVIFYINVCHMISLVGWLSQFVFDSQGDIVCSKDGTRRRGEPSAGENLSCVIIFVLVYYFLIAAIVWFVIFTYTWHMSFKALGKIQERIDKKGAYFHLVAWSLPLVLTITTMALGEIDGSSITGICFVGYLNHYMRAGFLLVPLLAGLLIGGFFLSQGILTLISVRTSSKDIISVRASSKIRATIMRCAVTAALIILIISATFICHVYEFIHSKSWDDSFTLYLICRLTSMYRGLEPGECVQAARPSVAMLQLQLLCLFASIILMASWVWTGGTIHTWKRYIKMKCGFETEEPVKLQKHKLIAQAFARRKEFHNQGRMSISFHNTHTDPVGLNFELNSVASHDFSSTWANNLPRFVKRRGALTGGQQSHSQSSSAPRRNSQDSQISFSLRHVSVESRRNSLDSQVVKIAEMKTKVASRRRIKPHKSSRRRPPRNSMIYTRKESTTSIESQIGTRILKAVSSTGEKQYRNMSDFSNRRIAAAGLNREQIDSLLANGKFVLPFLQNQGLTTTSDEDNASMASFKIRDSQLNIVLRQRDPNISTDEVGINSSNNAMSLVQYQSDSDSEIKNIERACIKYKNSLMSSEDVKIVRNVCRKENLKDVCGSKSSSKSKSSRKSSRQSGRTKHKRSIKGNLKKTKHGSHSKDDKINTLRKSKGPDVTNETHELKSSLGSSYDSYSVELGRIGIQSSYSGVSVGKNNSRNSKTSCDVGIQANSHEIATQTLSSHDSDVNIKNKLNLLKSSGPITKSTSLSKDKNDLNNKKTKVKSEKELVVLYKNDGDEKLSDCNKSVLSRYEECNEPLLGNKNEKAIVIKKRMDKSSISESKKLKQLLLPSAK